MVWCALKSPARMPGKRQLSISVKAVSPLTRYVLWSSVGFLSIHTLTISTSVPSLVGDECDDLDGILFRIIVSRPWHSSDAGMKYVWQFGTRIGGIPFFLATMRLSCIIAISMWSSCKAAIKADCLAGLFRPWAFQCRTRTSVLSLACSVI